MVFVLNFPAFCFCWKSVGSGAKADFDACSETSDSLGCGVL